MNDHSESNPNPKEKADWNDEEVIDLTDIAGAESEMAETIVDLKEVVEPAEPVTDESEDDVISLVDVVSEREKAGLGHDASDTIIDLTDRVDNGPSQPEPSMEEEAPVTAEAISLTEQQLEDALTQVIEKTYKEKIEQLLIQTIEKTVSQEIERIKSVLLSDEEP